ncbi:MAG: methionine biosynthesis protein MetW [Syntrophaceae bacterium]|nr:methionine biosynthesis protein MetW [Syntrophaceae bacterium]
MKPKGIRLDHRTICRMIEPGSRVLDLGCGNGDLLYLLAREKGAQVQGIELNESAIYECVKRGLSVFHGDLEAGLTEYPDRSFDYVILNQSLQEVKKIDSLIHEALRIGKEIIVGFPNFAYFKARWMLFFGGRAPITPSLPYRWYDTPNLRFLSIRDFEDFCHAKNLKVKEVHSLGRRKKVPFWPNFFALSAIFVITQ